MIGGHSPFQNGLWPFWYIIYKIWYILKKIWYNRSLSYRDPYLISHAPCIPLGIFEKWLKIVSYSEMDFGTLCTSLRNLIYPILELTRHLSPFSWSISSFEDPQEVWLEVIPYFRMDFGTFDTSFTKFGTFIKKFSTSNPWATKTLILLPMDHLFL